MILYLIREHSVDLNCDSIIVRPLSPRSKVEMLPKPWSKSFVLWSVSRNMNFTDCYSYRSRLERRGKDTSKDDPEMDVRSPTGPSTLAKDHGARSTTNTRATMLLSQNASFQSKIEPAESSVSFTAVDP